LVVGAISAPALVLLQDGLTILAKNFLHWNLQAEELVQKLGSPSLSEAAKISIGVTAIVIAPVAEEAIFRGVLYPTVKQMGYPRAALFGTSILFALAHASVMAFLPLMFFSMILIWLYEWSDNLLAPIMAHCALNALNYYWIVSAPAAAPGGH
jgi:membrane protease YdiL (CAAX protease family)